MQAGDELELNIDDVVNGGQGLARHDGMVIFVGGTLAGEHVRARLTRLHKRFAEARLLNVRSPAADRIPSCCRLPDGSRVPGCVYDHVSYPAEVALKQRQLAGMLARLPGAGDTPFDQPFASPLPLNYRNKIVLHAARDRLADRLSLGYVADDNRTVVDVAACPLARAPINEALAEFRASHAFGRLQNGQRVTLRWTPTDGVVTWVGAPPTKHPPLSEQTPLGMLRVPLDGFFQVNPEVCEALVRQVSEWLAVDLDTRASVLDLYCGAGLFTLAAAARGFREAIGIETGRSAVAAARINAHALNLHASFHCQDVAAAASTGFGGRDLTAATVIVDPPRQGLDATLSKALARARPRCVLYISCDPATLARDLRILLPGGYRIARARLFDMFPRTAHYETAVRLERQ